MTENLKCRPMSWVVRLAAFREAMSDNPPGAAFATYFRFGDRVCIDGSDVAAVVTGFCWKDQGEFAIEVSWLNNGHAHTAWFSERRLTHKEAP